MTLSKLQEHLLFISQKSADITKTQKVHHVASGFKKSCLQKLMKALASCHPRCQKKRRLQGRKLLAPTVMKKQKIKVVNPTWEKVQVFWHWTGRLAQKGLHPLCQIALVHLAAAPKGYLLSVSARKLILRLTSWARPWTTKQPLNCLSWPTSTD